MSLLKRLLGKAEPDRTQSPDAAEPLLVNAYSTLRVAPPLDVLHKPVGRRDLSDPELAEHLQGFIGYVLGRGDGQMTAARYHLWRHVQRVHNHLSFEVATHDLAGIEIWGRVANAVFFLPDGSVRAPDMAVILSANGDSDPSAAVPYQEDAVKRRQRTRETLAGIAPQPPVSIPPAIGEAELVLHSPQDVLRRALALFYVAAQAQARSTGMAAIPAGQRKQNPVGAAAITPVEKTFLEARGSDQDAASAMTWRYEAANTLLWALGIDAADIGNSNRMIDVDLLWSSAKALALDGATARVQLRAAGEILDALDRTWLEHWIVRQARQKDMPLDRLNGDIVMERHVALNWLTNFQNDFGTSWDYTDTPT
ncbi:hypothetical protein HMP09_0544 [Sphingomonas sp. HMP9]|uniref:DUF4272 domain-containing protein n=1 Tax=Sphingomonas sp. HMP9 TaxID=1517554 RepID=UPI001596ED60|nr:DUF4272 domain-containing protein [Sphingomonas sp. HMP9]BCA61310.1 hypothetical protein HMP09_0544 [Sphingomonas sp. HMP9]